LTECVRTSVGAVAIVNTPAPPIPLDDSAVLTAGGDASCRQHVVWEEEKKGQEEEDLKGC